MRSIWKGAISFGLVTIPVKLYSATEQKDVSFHQMHREDGGRIKYKRVCTVDGEEVPYSDIAKGYELATGEIVVLTDEDFADLPLSTSRRIDVLQFTPVEQIDPIYFAKSYYLEPDGQGAKPYVLLRDALERSGQVAIVKVALRQRESLATLRVRDGVFVLETMLWPDEVREAEFPFLEEDVDVRPQELKMAESLIDTMVADFDPAEYKDAYREALQEVIEAKVAGREVVAAEAPAEQGPAVDLMAALRASVEAAKREREGAGAGRASGAAGAKKKAPAKRAAEASEEKPAARKAAANGADEDEKAPARKRKTRRSA
ncbi:non-homologous end joining protein Ku [Microbispora sp. ATCC PTA-5024]|uniref:non-homologous end joining protein Ku n=1 Tax=Microbispora sp. ATCC PTA-5024 TaxID=316330 RepID=UPI0003DDCE3B|nr:Ku protein [Microbispora sp. ATCC PTA-5024]ETK31192.1 DNA repair protein [Microbispora sp. ATCC PTA-5024]